MLSVVIPVLNSERHLAPTLSALVPATMSGVIKEVIVSDGGSTDETEKIADAAGCHWVTAPRGMGAQAVAGAREATRAPWLLFLRADTELSEGWETEVAAFIDRAENAGDIRRAAAFRFVLADHGWKARVLEGATALRCFLLRAPDADHGLLISRRFYYEIGGFRDLPAMADADIIRRIGWRRMHMLRSAAVNSGERFRTEGYLWRMARRTACLALFGMRVPPRLIARLHG